MIQFQLLGTLGLARDDGSEARPLLVRPKQTALLAYLVLHQPRGWQQRNSLLALFWPESDDRRARFSLRSALHGLRSELGADAILARGDDELMVNPSLVRCDVLAFEDALDEQRPADALALYGGPLLEGLVLTGVPDFQIWADARRDGLRRRAVSAAMSLADAAALAGRSDDLVRWTRRALDLSPYEETLIRRLLQAFEQRGDRAEALAVYEQWSSRLRAELDSEPSPETVAVSDRLRANMAPRRQSVVAVSVVDVPTLAAALPTTCSIVAGRSCHRRHQRALAAGCQARFGWRSASPSQSNSRRSRLPDRLACGNHRRLIQRRTAPPCCHSPTRATRSTRDSRATRPRC